MLKWSVNHSSISPTWRRKGYTMPTEPPRLVSAAHTHQWGGLRWMHCMRYAEVYTRNKVVCYLMNGGIYPCSIGAHN